jgi:hypothetical protein
LYRLALQSLPFTVEQTALLRGRIRFDSFLRIDAMDPADTPEEAVGRSDRRTSHRLGRFKSSICATRWPGWLS